jgi:hypothetical protein
VYLCTWGPGCERVHDIADGICIELCPNPTADNVVITTWHDKDSIAQALWYFQECVLPAERYLSGGFDRFVVCVKNKLWLNELVSLLDGKTRRRGSDPND